MEPDLLEEALLMRALRDFNIPKIVREDEIVFFGLLGDLFPGIDPPRKVDPSLEEQVLQACVAVGNHPDNVFRLKVVELEELLQIRHCVFVMGPPGSGKTQAWKTLAEARNIRGEKTKIVDINPKSVKTEELYGFISMATREWRDGLLSKVMRDLGEIADDKPKWIILDGDLDAVRTAALCWLYLAYTYFRNLFCSVFNCDSSLPMLSPYVLYGTLHRVSTPLLCDYSPSPLFEPLPVVSSDAELD